MAQIKLPHDHGQKIEDVVARLPEREDFRILSDLYRQLSDPSRMRIFWILCHCEACVINISAMVEMSSPAVSHHLKQLKAADLIVSRREGKEVYYRAAKNATVAELHHMMETLMEISCPAKK